jgi:hypothetical protein
MILACDVNHWLITINNGVSHIISGREKNWKKLKVCEQLAVNKCITLNQAPEIIQTLLQVQSITLSS